MDHAGGQQHSTGLNVSELNLPTPRSVALVCRGLDLACVAGPVLLAVLVVFLAPGAASLCLVGVLVPPAGLVVVGTVALCCFFDGASRARTWFVRAVDLVLHFSEQVRASREEKLSNDRL